MLKNRVATLGTMADLHAHAAGYSLQTLARLVGEGSPDLLCLEITREAWEAESLGAAALPIRAALAPLAERSDIVVLPVAVRPREHSDHAPRAGARALLVNGLERLHRAVQWRAGARTINGAVYGAFCHTVCALQEAGWPPEARAAWQGETTAMLAITLNALRNDPGRRTLLVTQCQRKHWLDDRLRREADVELTDYWRL